MKMKIKRLLDFLIASLFLIIFLPMIVLCSILILIFDKQNPLFKQKRSGKDGCEIYIYKLTTMKSKKDKKYVTNLGNILRISKIDELPQLFNVLLGDMSFIGPRPLYLEFNQYLKKNHKLRLSLKPGITGLSQIRVKDSTDWNKKFNYDVIYVRRYNFKLDLYIFFETITMIIKSILFTKHRPNEIIDYKSSFNESYK